MKRKILLFIGVFFLSVILLGCDESVEYREEDHGTFVEEFPPHKKSCGWWYITGYLTDTNNPENMYSYQFTQISLRNLPFPLNIVPLYNLQLAVTDLQTGEHFFETFIAPVGSGAWANSDKVVFLSHSILKRNEDSMDLTTDMKKMDLDLHLDNGKGASWHCDNGILAMGMPDDPEQRTVYYSYTNMPTTGTLKIKGDDGEEVTLEVEGKSWFDRQWGPFRIIETESHWEWFSLRFFDNEEAMLFSFPQHDYRDGTFVKADGSSERLNDYTITPTDFIETEDSCYSFGWDLTMTGIKEEKYHIEPIVDGQTHIRYFEMIAGIYNEAGELVGYAFVECLPGLRPGMCPNS